MITIMSEETKTNYAANFKLKKKLNINNTFL